MLFLVYDNIYNILEHCKAFIDDNFIGLLKFFFATIVLTFVILVLIRFANTKNSCFANTKNLGQLPAITSQLLHVLPYFDVRSVVSSLLLFGFIPQLSWVR